MQITLSTKSTRFRESDRRWGYVDFLRQLGFTVELTPGSLCMYEVRAPIEYYLNDKYHLFDISRIVGYPLLVYCDDKYRVVVEDC